MTHRLIENAARSVNIHIAFNTRPFITRYRHEQYPDKLKDIAIIKTTQKIKFGLYVQPACIARGKDRDLYKPGTTALLSGWGSLTGYGQSNQPQFLQEAEMIVRDIKDCNDTFLHTSPMGRNDYCKVQ